MDSDFSVGKTLVIYHYFEKDGSYIDNFLNFITFGYLRCVDFLLVISGDTCLTLPEAENIRCVFVDNRNNDFGGYSVALKSFVEIDAYDYFVFVNSSTRGPYFPSYAAEQWTDFYTKMLSSDVGLVSSTINILAATSSYWPVWRKRHGGNGTVPHAQTTAYAMSREAVSYLIERGFYDCDVVLDKLDVILEYEIRLSRMLIEHGWNIKCFLPEYNQLDYREDQVEINQFARNGDPNHRYAYFGRTMHPYEVIFTKTNRGAFSNSYMNRLSYSMYCQHGIPAHLEANSSVGDFIRRIEQEAKGNHEALYDLSDKKILAYVPRKLRPLVRRLTKL